MSLTKSNKMNKNIIKNMTKGKIAWENVLERLIEETGAKNARELDELVGAPTNYSYQIAKRGMTKGYMEKLVTNFGHVDWNYIIKGQRTVPKESLDINTIVKSILESSNSNGSRRYIDNPAKHYEEVLKFIAKLIENTLEK